MAISYDPTLTGNQHPTKQGYTEDHSGTDAQRSSSIQANRLQILVSNAHLYYYREEQDLPGRDLEVQANVEITQASGSSTPDTGVHFELAEGTKQDGSDGYHLIVACYRVNNVPKIGIELSTGGFGAEFDVDWTQKQYLSFGISQGRAFLKINEQAKYINMMSLPTANGQPRFAFGCFSEDKNVTAYFGKIEEAAQTYPLAVRTINLALATRWTKLVELTAEITVDPASPGFDPAADGLKVLLCSGTTTYYPSYQLPIYLQPTADGWRIRDDQRTNTGLEILRVIRTPTPGKFLLMLVDMRTNLAAATYSQTTVVVESGRNRGQQALTLREGGGIYIYP